MAVPAVMFFSQCRKIEQTEILQKRLKSGTAKEKLLPGGDIIGKITVGYQGWFSATGDGSPVNIFGHTNLEMWPDTREYSTTYGSVPFAQEGVSEGPFSGTLGNGQAARMFSSYDQSTVNTHFKWMQQYEIDCAALQRFANEITPGSAIKSQRDGMAQKVRAASESYGRKFYIMYDASGWGDLAVIKADWTNTIKGSLDLLSSSSYAIQDGKPVVCIYGLGYAHHPSSPEQATDLINWFKSQGCYVIGSVPGGWRTGAGARENFISTFTSFDMISGWTVGNRIDEGYPDFVAADKAFCEKFGVAYQPCVYPGTAFHNTNGSISIKNEIPRLHGDFMWRQFAALKRSGNTTAYIAMFDELNEATSIFKVAEDASMSPQGKYFLTLDADGVHVSSDFYLRLVKDGASMLKGTKPFQDKHNTPFVLPGSSNTGSNVKFYPDINYKGVPSSSLPVGRYSTLQLLLLGMPNNWMSSVTIPKGRTVTMYADGNFKGASWTLTSDTPDFTKQVPNANDIISSVIVK